MVELRLSLSRSPPGPGGKGEPNKSRRQILDGNTEPTSGRAIKVIGPLSFVVAPRPSDPTPVPSGRLAGRTPALRGAPGLQVKQGHLPLNPLSFWSECQVGADRLPFQGSTAVTTVYI